MSENKPGVIPLRVDSIWQATGSTAILNSFITDVGIKKPTTFSGSGKRIYGDMSNATISNRLLFQTYVLDSYTAFGLIPNGSHDTSVFSIFNNSDPDNSSNGSFSIDTNEIAIQSGKSGTGNYLPIKFYLGGLERLIIDTNGYVGINEQNPISILDVNGDIHLSNITTPVDTTNKLYATGGNLYWNATKLTDTGGVVSDTLAEVLAEGNTAGGYQIDMSSEKIINVADPTNLTDASNRQYTDNIAKSMAIKYSLALG